MTFSKYINNHKAKLVYRLKRGEVACFNHRRVLHARSEFKTNNQGMRHFQGCYINIDEFKSEALYWENYFKHKENQNIKRIKLSEVPFGNQDYF